MIKRHTTLNKTRTEINKEIHALPFYKAIGVDANPAVFALTVAVATSNSFLIPTHQVNALIMGPGGYRVTDFLRAGGIMTILFLTVMMLVMGAFY